MNFLTVVKLTIKNARKSNIFLLLLSVLIITIFALPNIVSGDGTVLGFLKVAINYNITAIVFILSLSSIWLSCFVMTHDVEHYQIHMIVTKPISRTKLWLGKFTGIFLIHILLLAISFLTTFFFIKYQFNNDSNYFKGNGDVKTQKETINNELFTARRIFYPETIDINEEIRKKLEAYKLDKKNKYDQKSLGQKEEILENFQKEVFTQESEVKYKEFKYWNFKNLPLEDNIIYFKYRPYLAKVDTEDQRETNAVFSINTGDSKLYQKRIMTGSFHETPINSKAINKDKSLKIGYQNWDKKGETIFFTPADGPKLLIKTSTFFDNYIRAGVVSGILLFSIIGISCAIASFFHMSTAIFAASFYVIISAFFSPNTELAVLSVSVTEGFFDLFKILIQTLIIPIKHFDVSYFLANGELIEFNYIFKLFFKYMIPRALPLFLLGIYFYNKRELGLVERK